MKAADLARLRRVAQIHSDLEMKRFSALRAHMVALQTRKQELEAELERCYAVPVAFSLAEARLANTIARQTTQAIDHTNQELTRMAQRFEAGRAAATQSFGRVRVLEEFERGVKKDAQDQRAIKQGEAPM